MATRVALYTRVSTEDQAREGFSLDAQLERLRYFAKAQGWEIAGEYVDEGHSGRTTKRPQYQRMMDERSAWDVLLVLKMDRIHRNSRNFMAMMDELRREGKEFASVTESLDTSTAMGRFVMDIIQRIAQLESEQIGERVYVGMGQKAKQGGGSLGKAAPFGYRYEGQRLVPVPEEAPHARWIFEAFLAGERKQAIADHLNAAGVRTRRTGVWTIWSVDDILRNPTYAGALQWDVRGDAHLQLGKHEAIVDARTWDLVQDRLDERARRKSPFRLTRLQSTNPAVSHQYATGAR
ncbi:MAG TPA: recombinase family protein [Candidatus Thermoplasmatota archaeon]|nr:recombinase family protein [Candidatus Thermoplasmatota archaeon]